MNMHWSHPLQLNFPLYCSIEWSKLQCSDFSQWYWLVNMRRRLENRMIWFHYRRFVWVSFASQLDQRKELKPIINGRRWIVCFCPLYVFLFLAVNTDQIATTDKWWQFYNSNVKSITGKRTKVHGSACGVHAGSTFVCIMGQSKDINKRSISN